MSKLLSGTVVGDTVLRWLGGMAEPMRLRVTAVTEHRIICGPGSSTALPERKLTIFLAGARPRRRVPLSEFQQTLLAEKMKMQRPRTR
jgi:hypothetical protein